MYLNGLKLKVCLGIGGVALVGYLAIAHAFEHRPPFIDAWAVFHYYLGAKYFEEIGPFDLYACALEADVGDRIWPSGTMVRDLNSYALVPKETLVCPREAWSESRWDAFVDDVSTITDMVPAPYWGEVVRDKGYNASPFFSTVFGGLANLVPIKNTTVQLLLFNIDYVFLAISIVIIWRQAGVAVSLLTLICALGFFGNFGRIGGNYFQYAWLPLVTLVVAAWRSEKWVVSGSALGAATILQVFPILFAAPAAVIGLQSFVRGDDTWKRMVSFFVSLGVVVVLGFAVGSMTERGLGGWSLWFSKLDIHSSYLRGEVFNIGLPNLIAGALTEDQTNNDTNEEDIPHSLVRVDAFNERPQYWWIGALCLLMLMALSTCLIPREQALLLGFLPLYALVAISPYYYFSIVLLPFMAYGIRTKRYYLIIGLLAVLLTRHLFASGGHYISFTFSNHFVSEIQLLLFTLAVPLIAVYGMAKKQHELPSDR